ncbi:hypothetical protein A9Q98_08000 [Thalassotalea sp. 42_200_T64]|nr:hypothetical protein A9Q98_08000 [Thalassotalea sp. 42_200_T64]
MQSMHNGAGNSIEHFIRFHIFPYVYLNYLLISFVFYHYSQLYQTQQLLQATMTKINENFMFWLIFS